MAGRRETGETGGDEAAARRAAVKMLSRRDHSSAELRNKLLRQGFSEGDIQSVTAALAARGFLDDSRLASRLARAEMGRGRGYLWVRSRLAAKGLECPPGLVPPEEELAAARALLLRRGVRPESLTGAEERAKIRRFLRGRGFRPQAVARALGPWEEEEPPDEE